MSQKFTNVARSRLLADISAVATSLTIDAALADKFPVSNTGTAAVPTVGLDYFKVVVQDSAANIEIIYVRTRALGSNVLSNLLRGQEGTTARAFTAGTLSSPLAVVALRHTAIDLEGAIDLASSASVQGKSLLSALTPFNARQLLGITGETYSLGGVTIPDFNMTSLTPNGRVDFPSTNPQGWNVAAGRMTVDFELNPQGYFAANPIGHWSVVTRCDTAVIATAVRGQGIGVGDARGFPNGASDLYPTSLLETFFNGTGAGNFEWPASEAARSLGGLVDGAYYRFIIDSTKTNDGNRFVRYRMFSRQTAGEWRSEVDTGDVLDHNIWADLTKTGLVFAHVFANNLSAWTLAFTNIKVTWGPAESATPDITKKLSRYGAQLDGNLNFLGISRRITSPAGTGPSLASFPTFQTSTVNSSTGWVVKPNGTSTTSNFLFSNNSLGTTTYGAVTFGISGANALIETFGYSASNPALNINIGAGNTVASFSASGFALAGASEYMSISNRMPKAATFLGLGGSVATTWVASQANINFDTGICTDGGISNFIGGTYNQVLLELVMLPVCRLVSAMYGKLYNKGLL